MRDLIYVIPEWPHGFPYTFQFKSEFCNKELMIWATVSSRSCFCWLSRASPSLAAKYTINLISVLTIWWCPCVESSCVVGKGCLLWPVYSLGKTLLAFDLYLLYSKAKLACYSRYLLTSYFCTATPYDGMIWFLFLHFCFYSGLLSIFLLIQISLEFLLLNSVPYDEKDILVFGVSSWSSCRST